MEAATTITDDERLGIDLFAGDKDDAGARARTNKMVVTRKPHTCVFKEPFHEIPAGSKARCDRAFVADFGQWCSAYCCIPCLDEWLEEYP